MKVDAEIRRLLVRKFKDLRAENPKFSQRAFGKRLDLSSGAITEILGGRRSITDKLVRRWIELPFFDPHERKEMASRFGFAAARKTVPVSRNPNSDYQRLSRQQFQVIADWWHFAILSLMKTEDFVSDPEWIAGRLGLQVDLIRSALQRLIELGLISRVAGDYVRTQSAIRTPDDRPDLALRRGHQNLLKLASARIKSVSVEERDYSSTHLSIRKRDLPRIKVNLRRLLDEFTDENESVSGDADEVYLLGVQFFPLTRRPQRAASQ